MKSESTAAAGEASLRGDLTPKQAMFCREYLVDLNATQAALRAGYSEVSAHSIGCENLMKPEIQTEVQRLMAERTKRVELNADTVLRELMSIALVDIGEAFEDGALLSIDNIPEQTRRALAGVEIYDEFAGVGESRERIGQTKKIRFNDKIRALDLLGQHLGLWKSKVELTGANGGPIESKASMTPEAEKDISECMAAVRASLKPPGT